MTKPRRAGGASQTRASGQSAHSLKRLADFVDSLLPQMQCRQCGFAGCRPYAEAVAAGRAAADLCLPGGDETARAVARAAGVEDDCLCSLAERERGKFPRQVARIDENACVGCIKCIEACPVDAVVGSIGLMHTVMEDGCTGCGLCVGQCPVDCITLVAANRAEPHAATAVVGGVAGDPAARKVAETLRRRYAKKSARVPLRGCARPGLTRPEELAAAAMRRARSKIARRDRRAEVEHTQQTAGRGLLCARDIAGRGATHDSSD